MKRKTNLVILVSVIALAAGAFFFLNHRTEVKAMEVKKGNLKVTIEETGYVEADDDYLIQAPGTGRIIELNVDIGQAVAAGQVLMTLENLDLNEQLVLVNGQISHAQTEYEQAQNNLNMAAQDGEELRKELARATALFNAGAISQASYEAAINKVHQQQDLVAAQQASLKGVEAQLGTLTSQRDILNQRVQQFVITSQVAGKILDIPVNEGQIVATGATLLEVANTGLLTIKTDLLSDDMVNIRLGQNAEITAPVLNGAVVRGVVQEIYPKAVEKISALGVLQRRVPVVIAVNAGENLKPGYEVKVSIELLSRENVLVIPWEAVHTKSDGNNEVMLITNQKITYQPIKTGLKNQKDVEVAEGLQAGDQIVLDSSLAIKPGTRIKILR